MSSRLALGTVQFGLRYGIANELGQISRESAAMIMERAWSAQIDTLDTAISYGESEKVLGDVGVAGWRVVSKLPPVPENRSAKLEPWALDSVRESLERLGIPKLYGLLLHRPEQLLGPGGESLYRGLLMLKEQGKVVKIGISVYDPGELDAIWPHYRFDLVQAPFNVLDRRLAESGWLNRLSDEHVEVHVRSVFLQGLLLLESCRLPTKFARWRPLWQDWHRWLGENNLSALKASLGFALSAPQITRVVVGVDSLAQLEEILASATAVPPVPPISLACEDSSLINPSRWDSL